MQLIELDAGSDRNEPSQSAFYHRLADELHAAVVRALAGGSKRLLAAYLQSLLAYPDACTKGETVLDGRDGEVIASVPPLPEDRLYPKEQALVDLVRDERRQGRRVLVYITHSQPRHSPLKQSWRKPVPGSHSKSIPSADAARVGSAG